MHHLFTAPNCIRCKIVKAFLKEKDQTWDETDFQADKEEFNAFYRANRPSLYRNPEGVEFPMYTDGEAIKQGSGEIIAYLLSKGALGWSVCRSDLLHGWISGLYPSFCPADQEENFITLVEKLAAGGLTVCLRVDGRNPHIAQKLIDKGIVKKLEVNFFGDKAVYDMVNASTNNMFGPAPTDEEIAQTIEMAKKFADSAIRLQIIPLNDNGTFRHLTKEEASSAAKMIADACGDKTLPIKVSQCIGEELASLGLDKKVELLADQDLFKYRSACRDFLFKADIEKA